MKFLSNAKLTIAALSAIALIGTYSGCSKKAEVKSEPFLKIGGKTYSLTEFKSFSNMQFNHPDLAREGFFPGDRYAQTLFIETELLFSEAKKYKAQVVNGKEWDWKQEFLLGQYFSRNVLRTNLGSTDDELKKYFKANKGKILFEGNNSDTSFAGNFPKIIIRRFNELYPPTEEFKKVNATASEEQLMKFWKDQQLKEPITFFRNTYYKEYYKKDYPADYNEFYGDGKEITPEDLSIITKWLPISSREKLERGETTSEIINYLMTWKLFSRKAKEMGITSEDEYTRQSKWFDKYEVVRYYLNNILSTKMSVDRSSINPEIAQFALWDQKGRTEQSESDTLLLNRILDETVKMKSDAILFKHIYNIRTKKKVSIIHPDYKDELEKSSERVLFEADSLYGAANKEMAKNLYRQLIKNYSFSKEGVEAQRAMGMIDSDEGSYSSAIRYYRNYLLLSEPNDEWCKVFFMIAYAYGENLSNINLAAANYRWVLKNRPDCDFADDAEFMYLHLGEPINDVDEMVHENARQGRTDTK